MATPAPRYRYQVTGTSKRDSAFYGYPCESEDVEDVVTRWFPPPEPFLCPSLTVFAWDLDEAITLYAQAWDDRRVPWRT